jgi:uncharacterized protein (DUF488 family)
LHRLIDPDVVTLSPNLCNISPVYTIGHGNRPLQELVSLLHGSGVSCIVDVRAFPGSRRHPHFGRAELERTLPAEGIRYVWEGQALGGRRRPHAPSPHVALRNDSFRAYADHMETDEFACGIERLLTLSREVSVAVMCAERLPWQCHRYMISDYLAMHRVKVLHLIGTAAPRAHRLRSEARVSEGRLVYDVHTQPELGLE